MKQENDNKKQAVQQPEYEAPALTAVTFKAEKGYASSSLTRSIWIGAWTGGGDASNVNGVNDYDVQTTW